MRWARVGRVQVTGYKRDMYLRFRCPIGSPAGSFHRIFDVQKQTPRPPWSLVRQATSRKVGVGVRSVFLFTLASVYSNAANYHECSEDENITGGIFPRRVKRCVVGVARTFDGVIGNKSGRENTWKCERKCRREMRGGREKIL